MSMRLAPVDGLRALAVIAVVLYHVFPEAVTGGFIGVDVFFVISGFVIAHRYLPPLIAGEVRVRDFFVRRVQRLAPAYIVLLVAVTIAAVFILDPKDLRNYGESLVAQSAYLQNFAFWAQGDYFDRALLKPLLHTWSLAVEEQFYIFFPLLILVFRRSRALGVAALAGVFVLSVLAGLAVAGSSPKTAFYLLPTRAWEFIAGIAVALVYGRITLGRLAPPLFVASIATIVAAVVLFTEDDIFPGLQAALAVGGTAIFCLAQRETGPRLAWIATNGVSQHFGRISYSWYLWHWPISVFFFVLAGRTPGLLEGLACLVGGYVLAVASWRLVEQPAMAASRLRSPQAAIAIVAASAVFTVGAGAALIASRGALNLQPPGQRVLYAAQMDRVSYRCPWLKRLAMFDAEVCELSGGEGAPILLLGDSHANRAKDTLSSRARAIGSPLLLTKRNCKITDFGHRRDCNARVWAGVREDIRRLGVRKVVVISYWSRDMKAERYDAAVERLMAAGVTVYLQKVAPNADWFDPVRRTGGGPAEPPYRLADYDREYAEQNRAFAALKARHGDRLVILDPTPLLCADVCAFDTDGAPNYSDNNHLNSTGIRRIGAMYDPIFQP